MLDLYDYDLDESKFGILKKIKLGIYLGCVGTATTAFVALASGTINEEKVSLTIEGINRDFRNHFFAFDYIRSDDSYKITYDNKREFKIRGANADYFAFNYDLPGSVQETELGLQQHFQQRLVDMPTGKKLVYVAKDAVATGYLDRARLKPYYINLNTTTGYADTVANYYLGMRIDADGNAHHVPFPTEQEAINSISNRAGTYEYRGRSSNTIDGIVAEVIDVDGYEVVVEKTFFFDSNAKYTLSDGSRVNLLPDTTTFQTEQDALVNGRQSQELLERGKIQQNPTYVADRDWVANRFNDENSALGFKTKYTNWATANTIPADFVASRTRRVRQGNGTFNEDATQPLATQTPRQMMNGTVYYDWMTRLLSATGSNLWDTPWDGGSRATATTGPLAQSIAGNISYWGVHWKCGDPIETGAATYAWTQWKAFNDHFHIEKYLTDPVTREVWSPKNPRMCEGRQTGEKANPEYIARFVGLMKGQSTFQDGLSLYDRMFYDGATLPEIVPTEEEYKETLKYQDDWNAWRNDTAQIQRVQWNGNIYSSRNDVNLTLDIRAEGNQWVTADLLGFNDKYFVHNFNEPTHGISPTHAYDTEANASLALRNAIINWKPYTDSLWYSALPGNPYNVVANNLTYTQFVTQLMGTTMYANSIKVGRSNLLQLDPNIKWNDITEFNTTRIIKFEGYNNSLNDYYFTDIDAVVARLLLQEGFEGLSISSEWITDETTKKYYLESDKAIGSGVGLSIADIEELKRKWEELITRDLLERGILKPEDLDENGKFKYVSPSKPRT